jgi:hypothetical protein
MLLIAINFGFGQTPILSQGRVSVLTCGTGNESSFGHTAIGSAI